MEPQLPTPHRSPEVGPTPVGPEISRPQNAEVYKGAEKHEVHEQKQAQMDGDGAAQPLQQVAYAPQAPITPATPAVAQPSNSNPVAAADDDLIEKEWVEKAKKVIAETKQDPYMQKQAVSRLQADYIYKRYGKSVKLPEEG